MTNYKLVPFEPTPEMVEAAEEAHMPFGDMDLALRVAILAAPDVQGEPVATVAEEVFGSDDTSDFISARLPVGTKLYTAPQPPFQLPDFAADPDDSDEAASLWDHGFKRGWNSCLGAVAKAMQPTEQQPAPLSPPCGACGGTGKERYKPVERDRS